MLRFSTILLVALPVVAFASPPATFDQLIYFFLDYILLMIPLVAGATVLVFILGLVKFISRVGGNEKEIENGRRLMIYGIIGLLVMVSVWSIVEIVQGEFGFGTPFIPKLPES